MDCVPVPVHERVWVTVTVQLRMLHHYFYDDDDYYYYYYYYPRFILSIYNAHCIETQGVSLCDFAGTLVPVPKSTECYWDVNLILCLTQEVKI